MNNITAGEVFTARVYKRCAGQEWANSYEFAALESSNEPATMIGSLRSFLLSLERRMHNSDVIIDRIVISTYQPDSRPYDPTRFQTFPANLPGLRRPAVPLPLQACLFVRREPLFGRPGKLLYRGLLEEGDVAGYKSVIDPELLQTFQGWLNTEFGNMPSAWQMVLARGAPNPTDVRRVVALNISSFVVYKKLDNRYFDRSP